MKFWLIGKISADETRREIVTNLTKRIAWAKASIAASVEDIERIQLESAHAVDNLNLSIKQAQMIMLDCEERLRKLEVNNP
jgi:hypothetical protein